MISVLYVLCGIPASGKSTLTRLMAEHSNAKVYCFDNLPHAFSPSRCETVRTKMWSDIAKDLRSGLTVICDDLNTRVKWRQGLLTTISNIDCKKVLVVMNTPLDECIKRNTNRKERLSDFIVIRTYERYEPPTLDEGWDEIIYV